MSRKAPLMSRLDEAAMALLERHFPPPQIDTGGKVELPDSTEQTKAFDAVVRYFGPRTKLGGDDENKESEFDKLRSGLNGRRAARRRSYGIPPPSAANGSAIDDSSADAS